MTTHSDGNTKKKLIALLLLISSVISTLILVYSSEGEDNKLHSFAQADSLIVETLQQFNIKQDQYRIFARSVDSGFVRKTYTIRVPPGFSKTLLHTELHRTLFPLSVHSPASVSLPEEQMAIHLVYHNTVFRTLLLRTDEELILERDIASLLVAVDGVPSPELIAEIKRFGEPIPIVLRITDAAEARERGRSVVPEYPHLSYWIESSGTEADQRNSLPAASVLKDIPEDATVLSFRNVNTITPESSGAVTQAAAEKNISFIDVSDALVLDSDLGETFFKQELDKIAARARQQQHPVAIVMADEQALTWLREKLATFKKSGLYLIYPPQINF